LMMRQSEDRKLAAAALAAIIAYLLVAAADEPTALDAALYDLAGTLYSRRVDGAQRVIEIAGLPGAYIPAAHLIERVLRKRGHRGGSEIAAAAWAGWLTVRAMRLVIHRPRPPRPPGRKPKSESTFPSGHTTGLTTLALVAAHVLAREGVLTRRQARALGLGIPLLIGVDRVYVREHWFTDVLGGWALGTAAAAGTRLFVRRRGAGSRQWTRAANRST
jgi:membrane-associated phospholipid phosphatase